MFENSKVKAVAQLMSQVASQLDVEIRDVLPLGGSACVSSLDQTVTVAERPINGRWHCWVTMLDENGKSQPQMVPTVLNAGVPPDVVIVHALFTLAIAGGMQIEFKHGELVPNHSAISAEPTRTNREWAEFIDRWQLCVAQLLFKSQGMLPALPGNSASNFVDSNGLAQEIWGSLVAEYPEAVNYVMTRS